MANEIKRIFHGTTTTLEANGGSINNAAIGQANDASLDLGAYTSPADYPHVKFVFSGAFSVAPNENTILTLVARELDIDSTNDAEAPEATYLNRVVGTLQLNNVTSTQYLTCEVFDAPRKADYYIYNGGGQTLSAGWTLKATPFTYGPV